MDLQPGQIVRVRSRKYLVEGVVPPPAPADSSLVRLSCVEDDAPGEPLEVLWDTEVDARVVDGANWEAIASRGFDEPGLFSAGCGSSSLAAQSVSPAAARQEAIGSVKAW